MPYFPRLVNAIASNHHHLVLRIAPERAPFRRSEREPVDMAEFRAAAFRDDPEIERVGRVLQLGGELPEMAGISTLHVDGSEEASTAISVAKIPQ